MCFRKFYTIKIYMLGPNYPTSGHLSKETQTTISKGHVNPYAHCSIIYSSQDIEAS